MVVLTFLSFFLFGNLVKLHIQTYVLYLWGKNGICQGAQLMMFLNLHSSYVPYIGAKIEVFYFV